MWKPQISNATLIINLCDPLPKILKVTHVVNTVTNESSMLPIRFAGRNLALLIFVVTGHRMSVTIAGSRTRIFNSIPLTS
jgi:hypothetical protein